MECMACMFRKLEQSAAPTWSVVAPESAGGAAAAATAADRRCWWSGKEAMSRNRRGMMTGVEFRCRGVGDRRCDGRGGSVAQAILAEQQGSGVYCRKEEEED